MLKTVTSARTFAHSQTGLGSAREVENLTHKFTSLRHSLEKLQESEHFLGHLVNSDGLQFQFELNAFLSASRSVTFVLQKSFGHIPSFESWYSLKREMMKADPAMRFFIDLRNISQKEGPISYVGGALPEGGWTYRFVGRPKPVPDELVGRDIGDCCASYLKNLANLLQEYFDIYPFQSCPALAFSESGMSELGFTLADAEEAVGLPSGWTNVIDIHAEEILRGLRREIAPLDTNELKRLSDGRFMQNNSQLNIHKSIGTDLVDDIAALSSENFPEFKPPREVFIASIVKRIAEIDKD